MLISEPLLTVIVPCYNVEKYVDTCVSSIVNQTYANLEILLIDDGSTDSSGKICDAWQEQDSRIRAIHKQNEGLTYARKTGVEHAAGEFITFVDADDWIDINMYADMILALLSTNSDIAQCGVCKVFEGGHKEYETDEHEIGTCEVVGRIEGFLSFFEKKKWRPYMVNKIFKKHLFDGVHFPKGRGYAEDDVSLYLFHNASQSVYLNNVYYFYVQRTDSMSYEDNLPAQLKNLSDCSDAYYERYPFVNRHPEYHSVLPKVKFMAFCLGMYLLRTMIACPTYFTNECFLLKAKQIRAIPVSSKDKLPRSISIEWHVLKTSPRLFKFLRLLYLCCIRVTNKIRLTNLKTRYLLSDIWWIWRHQ